MVKITHYEVYTDRGDGWKLEGRFSSDQRHEAINLSKEKEQEKLKVKIIRESFDVQDNSYQETVEYVSGLSNAKKDNAVKASGFRPQTAPEGITADAVTAGNSTMTTAVIKLISIIILCLIVANLFVTLVTPLVENFVPEDKMHLALFVVFFVVFLGLAIPLILKKIPWYVFSSHEGIKRPAKERRYYEKAENVLKLYRLNEEYETAIAPAFPEASWEYKRYLVEFLQDILANVDSRSMFQDSFSKLGVKLVTYGGCLELSKYSGFRISEANSLLFEAFKILDGDEVDLEAFYESKKTFNDTKVAVFLTGVGAYLMAQVIEEKPLDFSVLKLGFEKWENLLESFQQAPLETGIMSGAADAKCSCLVNVQCQLKFFDEAMPNLETQKQSYWGDVHNIIYNLLNKYHGQNVIEREDVSSVEYDNTEDAVHFAAEFIKDISIYKEELNNENLIFLSKCNIVDRLEDGATAQEAYVSDILEHTYNNEIMVTERVKNSIYGNKYAFEFLGEKMLNKSNKMIALYKLIY